MSDTALVFTILVAVLVGMGWGVWISHSQARRRVLPCLTPGTPVEFRSGKETRVLYVALVHYSSFDGLSAELSDGTKWRADA